jgi:hypothetical protein
MEKSIDYQFCPLDKKRAPIGLANQRQSEIPLPEKNN